MARLAHGACLVQYGETVVLVTATVQNRQTHLPFFPLTVEYREKSYAAGKIPGGFFKREGAPQEKEVLSARLADRTLRPLFPDGWTRETQIIALLLSADAENDSDVLALTGASAALAVSSIPIAHPIAAVRVGLIRHAADMEPVVGDFLGAVTGDGLASIGAQQRGETQDEFVRTRNVPLRQNI